MPEIVAKSRSEYLLKTRIQGDERIVINATQFITPAIIASYIGQQQGLNNYLPLAGGTITGNLRLKGEGDFGNKINLGDGEYVYLHEDSNDHLLIYARAGVDISVGGGKSVQVNGSEVVTANNLEEKAIDLGFAKKSEGTGDNFGQAPYITVQASGSSAPYFYIQHPMLGKAGVELVLMTKCRRKRGANSQYPGHKNGWTVAQNFRRGNMSYGERVPAVFVFSTVTQVSLVSDYIKKYYMYPPNEVNTNVNTDAMTLDNLYFGGWNMSVKRQQGKVFGVAARRIKDGRYEYSEVTAILAIKDSINYNYLKIGVL